MEQSVTLHELTEWMDEWLDPPEPELAPMIAARLAQGMILNLEDS